MRKLLIAMCLFVFSMTAIACQGVDNENNDSEVNNNNEEANNNEQSNNESNNNENDQDNNEKNEPSNEEDEVNNAPDNQPAEDNSDPLTLEEISEKVMIALDNKDMNELANYVHSEKGILFTPYVFIEDNIDTISKTELYNLLIVDTVYTWGVYDGKGTPIELTGTEYFEEFIDMEPFFNPDDKRINPTENRGNTENNIKEVFPNSEMVEFYDEGSKEYAGIDWESINFVFEKVDGQLYLVAVVGDMWTV